MHPRYTAFVPEITIRRATEADGPTLAYLERSSPLVTDGSQLVIDRGDDYFAASRLMEEVTIALAEVDGEPAGVFCGALHRALLGGVERNMLYIHHARILPRFQDLGLGKQMSGFVSEPYKGRVDSSYWYIAPGNEHSQGFARKAQNRWTFGPTMIGMDTAALAGPPAGRFATEADAAAIIEMINAAHEGEEMFLPYTMDSLAARLARDPALYTWGRLWLTDHAVAGVWPEGEVLSVRSTSASGETRVSRGACVLDFGYLPGYEADLLDLLRAWCSWLAARGMEELSVFSSPHTRHWDLLSPLGQHTPFHFWTPTIPQPADAEEHGLYVDHIYF